MTPCLSLLFCSLSRARGFAVFLNLPWLVCFGGCASRHLPTILARNITSSLTTSINPVLPSIYPSIHLSGSTPICRYVQYVYCPSANKAPLHTPLSIPQFCASDKNTLRHPFSSVLACIAHTYVFNMHGDGVHFGIIDVSFSYAIMLGWWMVLVSAMWCRSSVSARGTWGPFHKPWGTVQRTVSQVIYYINVVELYVNLYVKLYYTLFILSRFINRYVRRYI